MKKSGRSHGTEGETMHRKKQEETCTVCPPPAYLHGHEAIIDKNLLGQEVGSDGGLVLVAELLVHILVHQ